MRGTLHIPLTISIAIGILFGLLFKPPFLVMVLVGFMAFVVTDFILFMKFYINKEDD
jgi:hypothetical protein